VRPAALAALVASGVPIPVALAELGVEEIEDDLIRLAIAVGAPLVPTLLVLEQQLVHQERAESEVKQAQAVPQATRKLLLWLPFATLLLSQLAGLETLQGLSQPIGLAALALAAGLIFLGARVSARMLRRLKHQPDSVSRELIALGICLSAGMGMAQVKSEIPNLGPEASNLIALSQRTGASIMTLISQQIASSNELALGRQLTLAKKLSVSLLIPLTVTTLPAFLLLTIVPMIIGITQ
jgi:tight adherence protein B